MQQKQAQTERRDLSPQSSPGERIPTATKRQPNKWVVLVTLDSSIVNSNLPTIVRSFHVPLGGEIEWVLLTIGRLADMTGRKLLLVLDFFYQCPAGVIGVIVSLLILPKDLM